MDKFLETYNLPMLKQENTKSEQINSTNEIEVVIKKGLTYKNSGLDGLRGEFYQIF